MKRVRRGLLSVLVVSALAGCVGFGAKPPLILPAPKPVPVTDMIGSSYAAADALISQLDASLAVRPPVIVATLVSINQLEASSPLGRLISEQMANRFAHHGYNVIEVKARNQLYLKRNEGELILSREIRDLAQRHKVQTIVFGTYAEVPNQVFVNLKVIELENNVVIAAFDYVLNKDKVVKSLLHPL